MHVHCVAQLVDFRGFTCLVWNAEDEDLEVCVCLLCRNEVR